MFTSRATLKRGTLIRQQQRGLCRAKRKRSDPIRPGPAVTEAGRERERKPNSILCHAHAIHSLPNGPSAFVNRVGLTCRAIRHIRAPVHADAPNTIYTE